MIRVLLFACTAISILWAGNVQAEEKSQQSYFELGAIASMIVQPSIGYWRNRTGIRFTGMYINEDLLQYHVNIAYEISESERAQHSINMVTSKSVGSDPGADYDFSATGIAYGLNYKGFFLELGLAVPWNDKLGNLANDPVVPVFYWGYIHRFK